MIKFKEYTKEVGSIIDKNYVDLVENIYAHDVAWDLSIGIMPDKVYLNRSVGINRYHRSSQRGVEIFNEIVSLMKRN